MSLTSSSNADTISLVEASISDLSHALSTGSITSTDLVARYLHRIAKYDWNGINLNSIPLLNPNVFQEAGLSDDRRAAGQLVRPLEGIPYTVKDNFAVSGMTAASGSPAFSELRPKHDAFVVECLRDAGAVLIGKTNMPPMAAGGMQRGLYGRAESPYNLEYLTAAFASGSSNGCATSTAASFAAFGLGSETVSSGRSPASNNGLVAYTPSRGAISCRGLWPLYSTCDVVTPYTRNLNDMLKILDVLVTEDSLTETDFWRQQTSVILPQISSISQINENGDSISSSLSGKRIGVPRMFIGTDQTETKKIHISKTILDLWRRARNDLESLGATVIETDFPVLTNYEATDSSDLPAAIVGCPPEWFALERKELIAFTWEKYLQWAEDPKYSSLQNVNPDLIFPKPKGYLPDRFINSKNHLSYQELIQVVQRGNIEKIFEKVDMNSALKALEAQRKRDFEDWMDENELDFVVFPANGDVGRADVETNEESAQAAMRNGVKFSHGNRVIRHLGIPTVNVTMGIMADTRMPVNLTFIGKAYEDNKLLSYAHAYEKCTDCRRPPPLTPELTTDSISISRSKDKDTRPALLKDRISLKVTLSECTINAEGESVIHLAGVVKEPNSDTNDIQIEIFVDGNQVDQGEVVLDKQGVWETTVKTPNSTESSQSPIYPSTRVSPVMIVILARSSRCRVSGELVLIDR